MIFINISEATGRLFLIGIPGQILDEETKRILEEIKPGGIILFARNIESPTQVKKLIDDIKDFLPYGILFAIDQEGGIVTRFREGFTVAPGAMSISATGNPKNAEIVGTILGKEMNAVGINWDLAPVVDINSNPKNPGIGVRSFGDTPETVMTYAEKFVDGLHNYGVLSCLKHFPGKGRVAVDAHLDLPVLPIGKEELDNWELVPFRELKADSMMPSHIYLSKIQEKKEPATMSVDILTGIGRDELGYDGIFVADDMLMGGIKNYYSPAEAVVQCFRAGMDVLTYCHIPETQIEAKRNLVKAIESDPALQKRLEESLERVEVFRKKALSAKRVSLEEVGTKENLESIERITDQSITALLKDPSIVPLKSDEVAAVYSVKLTRLVQVEDGPAAGVPDVAKSVAEEIGVNLNSFEANIPGETAMEIVNTVPSKGTVVVFTENAHLHPGQKKIVEELAKQSEKLLVVALRNPYDAFIDGVDNAVLSYGYELVQQRSLLKVLKGEIKPKGKLPVKALSE